MQLNSPFDHLRAHTGSTRLSNLPTHQLLYQAKLRLGPNTDPVIRELVERMDDALDHVEDMYREIDETEDKVNEVMDEIKHLPTLDDPSTNWACKRDDVRHNDVADKLDVAKDYLCELVAFIEHGDDS